MLRLDDLIGEEIELIILNSEKPSYTVRLHGVENGGIWIESAEIAALGGFAGSRSSSTRPARKPIVFLPYAQIQLLVSHSVELDETELLP
jgi:hypothetical protein